MSSNTELKPFDLPILNKAPLISNKSAGKFFYFSTSLQQII